jgi:Domain of unknown function (DUF4440)
MDSHCWLYHAPPALGMTYQVPLGGRHTAMSALPSRSMIRREPRREHTTQSPLPSTTHIAREGRTKTVTTRIVIAVAMLGCFALSLNLYAQAGGDVEQQIKHLQQESRDAQMKNDASWAQQYLADGFVAGNSWGEWETREDFIKDLQNKTNKWKSGNISDVQVANFGSNTAVSRYKFTYDAELRGKHRARTVICSDTWVNDSGTWNRFHPLFGG